MSAGSSDSPYREQHPPRGAGERRPAKSSRAKTGQKSRKSSPTKGRRGALSKASDAGGERRGRRKKKPKAAGVRHSATSHPTTRSAQVATREWLLKHYGPICAYCGGKFHARRMTLDHVAPRRGQTAYDRRDNLVLACVPCNQAKRDQSPLAYLLGLRTRAVNLVKFGAHLSQGLVDMARSLVPKHLAPSEERKPIDYSKWGPESDEDSPYRT